jgi:hypothetical protein
MQMEMNEFSCTLNGYDKKKGQAIFPKEAGWRKGSVS